MSSRPPQRSTPPRRDVQANPQFPKTQGEEAVRARHQRADARSDEPVPLRGARPLPADRHAGGARRSTSAACPTCRATRARRAASSTRSSPADRTSRTGLPLKTQGRPGGEGAPVPADRGDQRRAAGTLASGKTDNQILAVVRFLQETRAAARGGAGVEGHQHAHQGARARARRPRTTSTTRCSRTPTSSTPACASCRRTSGTRTARTWSRGRRTATPTTACAARWCRSCTSTSSSTTSRASGRSTRW